MSATWSDKEYRRLQHQLENEHLQHLETEKQLQIRTNELDASKQTSDMLKQKDVQREAEIASLKRRMAVLIPLASTSDEQLLEDARTLRGEKEALQAKADKFENKIREITKAKKSERRSFSQDREEMIQHIDDMNQEISDLWQQKAEISKKYNDKQESYKEVEGDLAKIRDTNAELEKALQSTRESTRVQLEEGGEYLKIEAIVQIYRKLVEKDKTWVEQYNDLVEQQSSLLEMNKELLEGYEALEEEHKQLFEKHTELIKQNRQGNHSSNSSLLTYDQLLTQLRSVQEEKKSLQDRLRDEFELVDRISDEHCDTKKKLEHCKSALQIWNDRYTESLREECEKPKRQVENLQNENETLKGNQTSYKQELQSAREKAAVNQKRINRLHAMLEKTQRIREVLVKDKEALIRDMRTSMGRVSSLERQIADFTSAYRTMGSTLHLDVPRDAN